MADLIIPLPEGLSLTPSVEGENPPIAQWLARLSEALKPLDQVRLANGGTLGIFLRSSPHSASFISENPNFRWGSGTSEIVEDPEDDNFAGDSLWIMWAQFYFSESRNGEIYNFYLDDFLEGGEIARIKLLLVLRLLAKRCKPVDSGGDTLDRFARAIEILTGTETP